MTTLPAELQKPPSLTPRQIATAGLRPRIPELLSPAGDWDAMRAAVANGADAVFFGLDNFNARHRATNFRRDELPEIVKYLHDHNVKGFLTLNTLLFSDELPEAQAYVRDVAAAGIDAVIVQDLGLCRIIQAVAPTLHIHASTQMTLTEPRGVEWVKRFGITRAVLARELSLDEIRKTALGLLAREKATGQSMPELEVFVHGALCVSYSGQCLTSESLGGRSANRGQCAQACRLPYDLIVDGQLRDLGEKAYLLSPQDLAAYDLIADLATIGVSCLKIEGRLKGAHYVAATTQTYRAAIQAVVNKKSFAISPSERADLEQTFSRGFTHGFLSGVNHQRLVHARFPKSRGVKIGTVDSVNTSSGAKFILRLENPAILVKAGDGIVFDEGHPDQDEQGGRIYAVRQLAGGKGKLTAIEVELMRGDANLSAVSEGAIVWRTDDPALRKRLEHSFSRDIIARRLPLSASVSAHVGQHLKLDMSSGTSTASAQWLEKPLEPAAKFPADEKSIRDQLSRLGDTPFELTDLHLDLAGGPMIPKSVLNDLRRQCVEQLLAARPTGHTPGEPDAVSRLRTEALTFHTPAPTAPTMHVLVRDLHQLDAVIEWGWNGGSLGMVYADFEDVRRYKDAVDRCRNAGVQIGLATVRVIKPQEEGFTRFILDCNPDALIVRNLPSLAVARELAPSLPLIGDYSLNISNELTAAVFAAEGVIRMVPSYDLSWKQLGAMLTRFDPAWFECVVHQHMPMFHMEHCVFSHLLSNGTDYRTCGRPCESHRVELKDRKGELHPLLADVGCRNTVFNAAAQSALEYLPDMLSLGIRHFRVELLREQPSEVPTLLNKYTAVLSGTTDPKSALRSLKVLGQLGVTRGTLDRE